MKSSNTFSFLRSILIGLLLLVSQSCLDSEKIQRVQNASIDSDQNIPIAVNITPPSFNEDTSSLIALEYTDIDHDLATACAITNLNHVTLTQSCSCTNGICTVGVKGTTNYNGAAYFKYVVTTNSKVSKPATAYLTIDPVDDIPVANNISPAAFDEDTPSIITLSYTDVDGDTAASCSTSNLTNVSVITPCSCNGAGVCTVTVQGSSNYFGSASFNYTVTANGQVSNAATASLTINPVQELPHAGNSSFAVTNSPATADGSDTVTITATIKDADNNPIPSYNINSITSDGSNNTFSPAGCGTITNGSGVITCTLASTSAQIKNLSLNLAGNPNWKTATATFEPGAPNAANSTFAVTNSPATADGTDTVTITATLKDANNNLIPNYAINSIIADGSNNTLNPAGCGASTDALGVITCTLASTKAETKNLALRIAAGVDFKTATAIFDPGAPNAANSTFAVTNSPATADGADTVTITATLRDADNNAIPNYTINSIISDGSNNTFNPAGCGTVTDGSGVITCTLASTKAETKNLALRIAAGVDFKTNTAVFDPGVPDAANSTFAVTNSPATSDGTDTVTITATLKDANNNLIPNYTINSIISDGTNNTFNPAGCGTITNGSGVITCTLASTKAQTKNLALRIAAGVDFKTATAVFEAGAPDAAQTILTASTPHTADNSDQSLIQVILKDAQGNLISNYVIASLSASGTANSYPIACAGTTDASGEINCSLVSTKAEVKTVALQLNVGVDFKTVNVTFNPDVPVAANSTFAVTNSPATSDGTDTVTITATLKDANNNLVPNYSIDAISSSGSNNTFSPAGCGTTTDASGVITCTLASTTAQTKNLSLDVDGTVGFKTATAVFEAGAPDAAKTTFAVTNSPATADGTDTITITATLRDADNNIVPNYTINSIISDGSNNTFNPAGCGTVTDGSGVITCTLASTKAETKNLALRIAAGVDFKTNTAVFDPGAPDAANSTFAVTNSPATSDGTDTVTITATLKDANNNLIPNYTIDSIISDGTNNTFNPAGCGTVTDGSGVITCTLASTKAETKNLALRIAAGVDFKTATAVFEAGAPDAANTTFAVTNSPATADGTDTVTITATLRDADNNIVPNYTIDSIISDGTNNTFNPAGCGTVTDGSGVITCTLASTKAEAKNLALRIAAGVDFKTNTAVFEPGVPDAANSTFAVTNSPATSDGTDTVTITATLKDANNNLIPNYTINSIISDGSNNTFNPAGCGTVTDASGVITCTLASTKAETKNLALRIAAGVDFKTATAVFEAGAPDAANTTFAVTNSPATADGTDTVTITATLRDADNNIVPNYTINSIISDGSNNTFNPAGCGTVTDASGIITCTLASTKAETKNLALRIAAGVNFKTNTAVFDPGAPDAANSTFAVTNSPATSDGTDTVTITATLKDANNNLIPNYTINSIISDGTNNTFNPAGCGTVTDGSGVITCTLASTKAETKNLALRIAAGVDFKTATAVFEAGAPDAANTTFAVTNSPATADGTDTVTITATLRDADNNIVPNYTINSIISDGSNNTFNPAGCGTVTDGSGVITCTLASTKAETKNLALRVAAGVDFKTNSAVFEPGVPHAASSTLTASTPVTANGTSTSTITLTLKDANNNIIPNYTIDSITSNGSNNSFPSACGTVTDASGVITCTMASTTPETKTITATIGGSSFKTVQTIFEVGVPDAAQSILTASSPHTADGSDQSTIQVILKDATGNIVPNYAISSLSASGTANSYPIACAGSTDANGEINCSLVSTKAEVKAVALQLSVGVDFKTVNVTFNPDVPNAANSTFAVTNSPATSDGTDTVTITATLKDANNNLIPNYTINSIISDGTNNTFNPAGCGTVTDGSGVITCTLASTKAETKNLALRIAAGVDFKTATAVFEAGAPDAANTTFAVTNSPATADGTDTVTITATLRDADNNIVPNYTIDSIISDGTNNTFNPAGCGTVTDASGVITCTLASTKAETKNLALRIAAGVDFKTNTAVFEPGVPDAANSTFAVTNSPATSDGTDTVTITATLKDANNNLIPNYTINSIISDGTNNTFNPAGCGTVTDGSGVITCTLASTKAETKNLALRIAAGVDFKTATAVFEAGAPDAANTTFAVTNSPATADGVDTVTLTATLKDADNNIIPNYTIDSIISGGTSNTFSPAGCGTVTDASGVITCTLASTKAETKNLALRIAAGVNFKTNTAVFEPGVPHAASSTLTASTPVTADGIDTSSISFTLKDANGNIIPSYAIDSISSDGSNNTFSPAGCGTTTDASGVISCTLKSTMAQTKTITVTLGGSSFKTVQTVFESAAPDAANSTFAVTNSPATADGTDTVTITVTLKDANNNVIPNYTINSIISDGTNNTFNPAGCGTTTDGSGVITCTLASTKAETKNLALRIAAGVDFKTTTAVFEPGAPDATNSTFAVTNSPATSDGTDTVTITATLKDANNNLIPSYTINSIISDGTNNTFNPAGCGTVTDASGVITCTLASTKAQTKNLALRIAAGVDFKTAAAVFEAGAPDATQSILTASTPHTADDSDQSTIQVILKDAQGNLLPNYAISSLSASGTANSYPIACAGTTDANGEINCSLVSTKAEVKTVALQLSVGVDFKTVNVTFNPDVPNAANSTFAVTNSPATSDGTDTVTITATLKDANNNLIPNYTIDSIISDGTNNTFNPAGCGTVTDGSGVITCTLASTTAQTKNLKLRIAAGVDFKTATAVFEAGAPDAANTTFAVTNSPAIADGTDTVTITATLKDADNNIIPNYTINSIISDGSNNTFNPAGCGTVTDASGVITCTLASTKAETKNLALRIAAGVDFKTNTAVFEPGAPDAANSTFAVTNSPATSDGTDTVTITATLKDANNNLIPNYTINSIISDGSNNTFNPAGCGTVTDASGVITCTLASTKAETKNLALRIAAGVDFKTATAVFEAGAPDAANTTFAVTNSPATADGTDTVTITATLRDADNNIVPNYTINSIISDGTSNTFNPAGCGTVTDASGVITCTLASTKAETKNLALRIAAGVDFKTNTAVFDPGAPDAANSTFAVTNSPATSDGTDTVTITATLKDANNNLIPNYTINSIISDGTNNTFNPAGCGTVTDGSGVITCTLASTKAETKNLALRIAAGVDFKTTTAVFEAGAPNAANSTFAVTNSPATADGTDTVTITATLRDADNNIVPNYTINSIISDGSNNTFNPAGCGTVTDASGVITCTLASTKAETKNLALRIAAGVDFKTNTAVFEPGVPHAASSTLTASTPVTADGIDTSSISFTLKDANGNIIPSYAIDSIASDGSNNTFTPAGCGTTTDASGVISCTLKSTMAQTKTITVTLGGSSFKTVQTVFESAAPDAANSTFAVTNSPATADGTDTVTITVTLKDASNNLIPNYTINSIISDGSNNTFNPAGCGTTTDGSGVITCTLASTKAETKNLALRIAAGVDFKTTTAVFEPGAPDATNSTFAVTNSPATSDGTDTVTITATLKDANNNLIPSYTINSIISDGINNTFNPAGCGTVTDASGVITCTLASTKAQTKNLALRIAAGVDFKTTTAVFEAGAPDAANTTFAVTNSPATADGTDTVTITVTLKDASNNLVTGYTINSIISDGTNNTFNPAGCGTVTDASGVITCTLASTKAETKNLALRIAAGVDFKTATAVFEPGAPNAANSTFAVTNSPATADGTDTVTITATLKDANNNLISNYTIDSVISDGTNNTFNPAGCGTVTDGSGVITCTLASTTAQTKNLKLRIAAGVDFKTTTAAFEAGVPDATQSILTASTPHTADDSDQSTIQVILKDAQGNLIPSYAIFSLAATGTGNSYPVACAGASDTSGEINCSLISTKAEVKTVKLQLSIGVDFKTANVTFNPGVPDATKSTLTASSPVVADGSSTSAISFTLKDAYENLITSYSIDSIAANGSNNSYPTPCGTTTHATTAKIDCTLASTTGETKTVTATVGGSSFKTVNVVFDPYEPNLAWSPLTHAFGSLQVGTNSSNQTFTLTNSGTAPATGCSAPTLTNSTDFSIQVDNCSTNNVNAAANCTVEVRANPASSGAKTTTLSRTCTVGGTVSTTANQITVTGLDINLAWSPLTHDFGSVATGSNSSNQTFTLSNSGADAATGCSAPSLTGTNADQFSIQVDNCSTNNLNGSANCTVEVRGSPTSSGVKMATLTRTCTLGGTVTTTANSITVTGAAPVLAWSPLTKAFGSYATNDMSGTFSFTLSNTGDLAASGCSAPTISNSTDFEITLDTCGTNNVGVSGSCYVHVKAKPQSTGAKTATISRICSVGGTVSTTANGITVTGTNPAPALSWNVTTHNFSNVLENVVSYTEVFSLMNRGTASATGCSAPTLGGTNPSDFEIVTDNCGTNNLSQNANCTVLARVKAAAGTGTKSATLSRTCTLGGTLSITLSTKKTSSSPVSIPVKAVGSTNPDEHNCAINASQIGFCWGENMYGQLGNGTSTDSTTPTEVSGISGLTKIVVGDISTCALLTDQTVKCWGNNGSGQLGNGTNTNSSTPVSVTGLAGVVDLSLGNRTVCAVISDGTINCWGENGSGQVGDGTNTSKNLPTPVSGISTAVSISVGISHTCALLSDATVSCWGLNMYGQLGDNTTVSKNTPIAVSGLTNVVELSTGGNFSCALLTDDTVKCWGRNASGQLADGTSTDRRLPVSVSGLSNVVAITTGANHACAKIDDGLNPVEFKCWGLNMNGQLGDGTLELRRTPVSVNVANISTISAMSLHTCAIMTDNSIKCWGDNKYGQLGDGTFSVLKYPTYFSAISSATLEQIAMGDKHACSLDSGIVKCWGNNDEGQLGLGTNISSFTPATVPGLSSVTKISVGQHHTCALISGGTVKCWGYNVYGQIGDGTTVNKTSPTTVSGLSNVIDIASGSSHNCAIISGGTVKCWGSNGSGQLGDNSTTSRTAPVDVSSLADAQTIALGGAHTCVLTTNSTMKCWGDNGSGRLGDGTTTNRLTPVEVVGLTNVTSINLGSIKSCAIISDGSIKCWGYARLGDGTASPSSLPVHVLNVNGATSVSNFSSTGCISLSDGTVKCWGFSTSYELGAGSTTTNASPAIVPGLNNVAFLSNANGNGGTMCAIKTNGDVYCWGDNEYSVGGFDETTVRSVSGF